MDAGGTAQGYRIPAIVTSNRAPCDLLNLLPFDLWVNACRATAIEYTCTKFGVDSSSHFSVRTPTNRQMHLNALPTQAAMPAWVTTHAGFIMSAHIPLSTFSIWVVKMLTMIITFILHNQNAKYIPNCDVSFTCVGTFTNKMLTFCLTFQWHLITKDNTDNTHSNCEIWVTSV